MGSTALVGSVFDSTTFAGSTLGSTTSLAGSVFGVSSDAAPGLVSCSALGTSAALSAVLPSCSLRSIFEAFASAPDVAPPGFSDAESTVGAALSACCEVESCGVVLVSVTGADGLGTCPSRLDKSFSAATMTDGTPSVLPMIACTGTVIGRARTCSTANANCAK
ncbi:Uncharacterised protein [Mycobacteroides abscessus subsp. abscessus]|nr:Uncharacterised protein [Mycobacteroides abscessus subsp. abscessus]